MAQNSTDTPAPADPPPSRQITFTNLPAYVFELWRQFARTRNAIILNSYRDWAKAAGVAWEDDISLADARQRFLEANQATIEPTNIHVDISESRMVWGTRLYSGWAVLWTSILPMLAVACWAAPRLASAPIIDALLVFRIGVASIVFLWIAAFVGLIIFGISAWRYLAFINWLFDLGITEPIRPPATQKIGEH